MPKFEFEEDVSLDDVWNRSTRKECDEFFYRTLQEIYDKPKDIKTIKRLIEQLENHSKEEKKEVLYADELVKFKKKLDSICLMSITYNGIPQIAVNAIHQIDGHDILELYDLFEKLEAKLKEKEDE